MYLSVYGHLRMLLLLPVVVTFMMSGCRDAYESTSLLSKDVNPSKETEIRLSENSVLSITLRKSEDGGKERFVLNGLSLVQLSQMLEPQVSAMFTVHVVNKDGTLLPEMLGKYYQKDNSSNIK